MNDCMMIVLQIHILAITDSKVIQPFLNSLYYLFLTLLSVLIYFLINLFLVFREEGPDCSVVNEAAYSGFRVQKDDGECYSEGHVSELVEE